MSKIFCLYRALAKRRLGHVQPALMKILDEKVKIAIGL